MLDACRKIFETEQPPYGKDWRGDQGIMTYTFLRGVVPTVLDHECRIFQTMCSLPKDSFTIENGRFRNVKTQTTPGVLHFAGHTGGASNFYKMLYD